jgi:hypothetical protein
VITIVNERTELASALRRLRARAMDAPALDPLYAADPRDEDSEPADAKVDVEFEMQKADWEPRSTDCDPRQAPRRFIDGSMKPHLVMSLEDSRGRPRPVILATVGAVALDLVPAEDGHERLRRAGYQVDTCLVFLGNGLDGRDVDILARACQAEGIRVLAPDTDRISTDYDEVRQHTLDYVRREMLKLETSLLRRDPLVPTIVDGLLDRRLAEFTSHNVPAVGVVKRQQRTYLHSRGVQLVYSLRHGERSPAILLSTIHGDFVSFYLRLANDNGAMPHSGVVRVMVSLERFDAMERSWVYLDRLAHWICRMRCLRTSYSRALVSLEPIVQAEEHIKSLLPDLGERVGKFNHIMGFFNAPELRAA